MRLPLGPIEAAAEEGAALATEVENVDAAVGKPPLPVRRKFQRNPGTLQNATFDPCAGKEDRDVPCKMVIAGAREAQLRSLRVAGAWFRPSRSAERLEHVADLRPAQLEQTCTTFASRPKKSAARQS